MKCRRLGCNNTFKGMGKARIVTVHDKRLEKRGLDPERKEVWCFECVGAFQPNKYRLIYADEKKSSNMSSQVFQMKMKRKPLPKEEQEDMALPVENLAPIVEDEPVSKTKKTKTASSK